VCEAGSAPHARARRQQGRRRVARERTGEGQSQGAAGEEGARGAREAAREARRRRPQGQSLSMIAALLWALLQDPTAVAREHFRAAEAAEKRGDYDTALQEYVAAYEAKPHPAVLYNIATVYERLGDPEEAVHYYQKYLEGRPDATDAASVRARVGQIKKRPAKSSVDSQATGAAIHVHPLPNRHH